MDRSTGAHWGRRAIAAWLAAAAGCVAPLAARADTRSDYSIVCLDLVSSDPGQAGYPSSTNGSSGTLPLGGGSASWDLFSDGWMPQPSVPFLTQSAGAWTSYQDVAIPFGPGCQFFAGTQSRIVIRGLKPSAPSEFGTAPAQIRVDYHVLFENQNTGTGAVLQAVNGVNVVGPSQLGSASGSLSDSSPSEPASLTVPATATVTDLSENGLTRKDVEDHVILSEMLSYGPGALSQIDITFFTGTLLFTGNPTALVTGEAAALAGETAVTEVTSLDPAVEFSVVTAPEPAGTGAGGLAILVALAARRARTRRDSGASTAARRS